MPAARRARAARLSFKFNGFCRLTSEKPEVMASSVSLNLRVTTPGARKGEKRRPKGPEIIAPHVGHNESKLLNALTKCATVEEQARVVKDVSTTQS